MSTTATPAPVTRWRRFKGARVLGIPAPIIAAFLLVALTGGAAWAAVTMRAKIDGSTSVKALPGVGFVAWSGGSTSDPLSLRNNSGFQTDNVPAKLGNPDSTGARPLSLNLSGFPGSEADLTVYLSVPVGTPAWEIESLVFDAPGYTATLVDDPSVTGEILPGVPQTAVTGSPRYVPLVIHFEIAPDAAERGTTGIGADSAAVIVLPVQS